MSKKLDEIENYLDDKERQDMAYDGAVQVLKRIWRRRVPKEFDEPTWGTCVRWLQLYGPAEIEYAIDHAAMKHQQQPFIGGDAWLRYASAIMRRRKEDDEWNRVGRAEWQRTHPTK